MSVLSPAIAAAYHAVTALAAVLIPVLGGVGTAAAIVLFTAGVRLALHPLARAQARAQASAQEARADLAPQVARLQRKHKNDPARVQRETLALYREHGVPLMPGVLPSLVQIPVFLVVYRLFVSPVVGGHGNGLLTKQLFGVGLGSHLRDVVTAPLMPGHVAVFAVLLAAVAAVAVWSSIRMRATAALTGAASPASPAVASAMPGDAAASPMLARVMRLLPFGTVVAAAVLPLATGLYLVTTTLWTLLERRHLQRRWPQLAPAPAAAL